MNIMFKSILIWDVSGPSERAKPSSKKYVFVLNDLGDIYIYIYISIYIYIYMCVDDLCYVDARP